MRFLSAAGLLRTLVVLTVSTGVITASFWLFRHRHRLFRPDVARTGGTELVFALDGDAPEDGLDELVRVLERRLDPGGALGVVVSAEGGHVSVKVPRGKRHDELVALVRRSAASPGRLELCLVAHSVDDAAAQAAAAAQLNGLPGAGRTAPPPAPKNPAGEPSFPLASPPGTPHRYRWAPLSASAQASVGLHRVLSGATADRPLVEQCLRTGEPFAPSQLPQGLVYAAQPAGAPDPGFHVLVREPPPEARVTADLIDQVRSLGRGRRGVIHVRLRPDGARRLAQWLGPGLSPGSRAAGDFRHLAVLLDGQVLAVQLVHESPHRDLTLYTHAAPAEVDDLIATLRAGPLPAPLKPTPVREAEFDPR